MPKKTKADPTGQAHNRRKAYKVLSNRIRKAKIQVRALFRTIPKKRRSQQIITNESAILYDYEYNEKSLRLEIERIVGYELQTISETVPPDWFYLENAEQPYREGTAEAVVESNRLIETAVILGLLALLFRRKIDPGVYLRSAAYTENLQSVYQRSYAEIQALSGTIATQVTREIINGMESHARPSDITASINERFDVADSRAGRIATTETNRAYNDGIIQASNDIANSVGYRQGVQHISALLPTTREHHAARHRLYYTPEQQTAWWNEGANRINCHCTARPVLLDQQGNPVERTQS